MTKNLERTPEIRAGGMYVDDGAGIKLVQQTAKGQRPGTEADPLEGVKFGSASVADFARSGGLSAADFDGCEPTGKNGFTKSDVKSIMTDGDGAAG